MTDLPTSLVDILRWRATNQPQRLAYRWLADGEYEQTLLTYDQLDHRAQAIGGLLQFHAKAGDRALLIFAPGIDFIAAYFGCQYAGIIAIPVYPPHPARPERTMPAISRIIENASPAVILTTSLLSDVLQQNKTSAGISDRVKLLVTDDHHINQWTGRWREPLISNHDIAFIQYTSGSTTTPRGVMVNHGNLLHNLAFIENCFGQSGESHAVIWLPPYHDMGLVGGILQPLYSGYPVTLMPHTMFLQRPYRWLQAISHFKATTSGGPNFAYDLCSKKITPKQIGSLDLSSWKVAFNGAEKVFHKTLEQFAERFAPCGFYREAFSPCYGLAEATLMVSGKSKTTSLVTHRLVSSQHEQHRTVISDDASDDIQELVSCGQKHPDMQVKIVDAETLLPCGKNETGEIWVSGPGVASGYWNNPSDTEATFGAKLKDSGEETFLRTGDLGFLHEGELFITGRLKDLIISDGHNHYAHDIERTAEHSHPAIRPAGCAAFAISNEVSEQLIIIAEIEHRLGVKAEEIITSIRKAVSIHHELPVTDIRLTKAGGIPRTPSGKIKHYLCKSSYMSGTLNEIALT